jgi:hypothetical protein
MIRHRFDPYFLFTKSQRSGSLIKDEGIKVQVALC